MSDSHSQLPAAGRSAPPVSAGDDSPTQVGDILRSTTPLRADDTPTMISKDSPLPAPFSARGSTILEMGKTLEGERLGHFELSEFVGGGGMGVVFRAVDTMLGRTVAVKVLSQEQANDEDTLLRFKNEAQSAARLDHQNIARVYYVGEDRGLHYIVFEFIEGVNIRDLVEQRGPLPLSEAISFTLQIAEALHHASQRDVVHRDIKPSNVLIAPDGQAKLVDMGLARLHQVEQSGDDLTASGVTLGTFDYISPEQARDPRLADVRSDIYSLGCTLFFMLTGRPPFPDGTVLQKLLQHQGDAPPDVGEHRPDLPDEAKRVLSKMLAKSPAGRHQDPRELIGELLLLADQLGLQGIAERGRVWLEPVRSRWRVVERQLPWAIPVATLLAMVWLLNYLWTPADKVHGRVEVLPGRVIRKADPPRSDRVEPPSAKTGQPSPAAKGPSDNPSKKPATDPGGKLPPPKNVPPPAGAADPATPAKDNPPMVAKTGSDPPPVSVAADTAPAAAGVSADTAAESTPVVKSAPDEVASIDAADASPPDTIQPPRVARRLIVDGTSREPDHYATLAAAAAQANAGDTIELAFNRTEKPQRPMSIDKKLTIVAAADYRPVLVFRPTLEDVRAGRSSMIRLGGGEVSLEGVDIQMDLSPDVEAGRWTLLEIQRTELTLRRVVLTIRNVKPGVGGSYQQDVAFFDVRRRNNSTSAMPTVRPFNGVSTIKLYDCVVRGEAACVRSDGVEPFLMQWNNGLLATTQRLLVGGSGQSKPPQEAHIRVGLSHVTALLGQGLFYSVNDQTAPHQQVVDFNLSDCILMGEGKKPPPLVQLVGIEKSKDDFRQRVPWTGHRNFYDSFDLDRFWTFHNEKSGAELASISFGAWKASFKRQDNQATPVPPQSMVIWERWPEAGKPVHRHVPADYVLSRSANPPLSLQPGGKDAGFVAGDLPQPAAIAEPPSATPPAPSLPDPLPATGD